LLISSWRCCPKGLSSMSPGSRPLVPAIPTSLEGFVFPEPFPVLGLLRTQEIRRCGGSKSEITTCLRCLTCTKSGAQRGDKKR
jgi:hypothetical protein